MPTDKTRSQHKKFIQAAREAGADEDPEAFKERLKRLVNAPPPQTVQERKRKTKGDGQ